MSLPLHLSTPSSPNLNSNLEATVPTDTPSNSNPPVDPTVAGFILSKTTGLLTSETGGTDSFTIKLTKAPTDNVVINVLSLDTTEITVTPTTLTFTPSNWDTEQTVVLTGVNDSIQDGNQAVTIDLGVATSSDSEYNTLPVGSVDAVNVDDDIAGLTVFPLSGLTTTEAGGTASFTVVLNTQPTANVVFPVVSNNTTEGVISVSSLTFTPANWNVPQTVTITGVDDLIADGNILYTVNLQPSTSADPNYNGLSQPNISVTNMDNDTAGFTITNTNLTTSESGTSSTFFVVLNSQPTADVVIPLTNGNPTEGSLNKASLTFTPTSWNIQQSVTVTGVDDSALDGHITYQITVGAPVSTDMAYATLSPSSVTVTNMDNDSPGFDITAISRNTVEDGTTANFKVKLLTIPSANVTITFTSSDTTEGIIISGASLTFTPANWNVQQTVVIKGVNDSFMDGDIAYQIISNPATSADPNYNGLNPDDVDVINEDDDTAGFIITAATDPLILLQSREVRLLLQFG